MEILGYILVFGLGIFALYSAVMLVILMWKIEAGQPGMLNSTIVSTLLIVLTVVGIGYAIVKELH